MPENLLIGLTEIKVSLPHLVIALFIGLTTGFLIGWIIKKIIVTNKFSIISSLKEAEISALIDKNENKNKEINELKGKLHNAKVDLHTKINDLMEITGRLGAASERAEILEQNGKTLAGMFQSLSAGALRNNNQAFLELAQSTFSKYLDAAVTDFNQREERVKNIVQPVREALDRYDNNIKAMELAREKAYGGLSNQVMFLADAHKNLQKETGNLVKALRMPHVRGRWGELTLKRVVELAGMTNRCDFIEQVSLSTEDGTFRPDMIVQLPGNHNIVVDAKVPLNAYLDSLEADSDNQRRNHLASHAKQLVTHINLLAKKSYWKQFTPTPEFVVLFIPGENFFSAAVIEIPQIIENAAEKGIILANPTTLISILKAVSYGWQRETSAENAMAISKLGNELYERLLSMVTHMNKLGKDIDKCASTYNQTIGSIERRVLVSARKFDNLGISSDANKKLTPLESVNNQTRKPQFGEME